MGLEPTSLQLSVRAPFSIFDHRSHWIEVLPHLSIAFVAQAGVEPAARAYEAQMLPLHYRAKKKTEKNAVCWWFRLTIEVTHRLTTVLRRTRDSNPHPNFRREQL